MSDDPIRDRESQRNAWDDDEETTRIAKRVGAALNSGRDKAVVDVVLSETDALRREMASDRAHLEQRTEALGRTIATKDALQAAVERVRALADDLAQRAESELADESMQPPGEVSAAMIGLAHARGQAADAIRRALGES